MEIKKTKRRALPALAPPPRNVLSKEIQGDSPLPLQTKTGTYIQRAANASAPNESEIISMNETPENEETISVPELLKREMIINQALIDILVEKGVLTHEEIQAKIKEIKIRSGILLSSDASGKVS